MSSLFFFNDTATTEIYTLSLHDALPIYYGIEQIGWLGRSKPTAMYYRRFQEEPPIPQMSEEAIRSEEHTSELQSRQYLVCRLLLAKKKTHSYTSSSTISS